MLLEQVALLLSVGRLRSPVVDDQQPMRSNIASIRRRAFAAALR
jgi:hypothetical protein